MSGTSYSYNNYGNMGYGQQSALAMNPTQMGGYPQQQSTGGVDPSALSYAQQQSNVDPTQQYSTASLTGSAPQTTVTQDTSGQSQQSGSGGPGFWGTALLVVGTALVAGLAGRWIGKSAAEKETDTLVKEAAKKATQDATEEAAKKAAATGKITDALRANIFEKPNAKEREVVQLASKQPERQITLVSDLSAQTPDQPAVRDLLSKINTLSPENQKALSYVLNNHPELVTEIQNLSTQNREFLNLWATRFSSSKLTPDIMKNLLTSKDQAEFQTMINQIPGSDLAKGDKKILTDMKAKLPNDLNVARSIFNTSDPQAIMDLATSAASTPEVNNALTSYENLSSSLYAQDLEQRTPNSPVHPQNLVKRTMTELTQEKDPLTKDLLGKALTTNKPQIVQQALSLPSTAREQLNNEINAYNKA